MKLLTRATLAAFSIGMALPVVTPADDAAKILTVRREAFRVRENVSDKAKPQMTLNEKDVVRTGSKSGAKIFFKDDSILNLGEQSAVSIDTYLYSEEKERAKSIINLIDGSLKVVVGRSDLEIHTKTAVAAARGTKYVVFEEGQGKAQKSTILVLEGAVAVSNAKAKQRQPQAGDPVANLEKEIILTNGWMSSVSTDAAPTNPEKIPPHLLERYNGVATIYGRTSANLAATALPPANAPVQTRQQPISAFVTPTTVTPPPAPRTAAPAPTPIVVAAAAIPPPPPPVIEPPPAPPPASGPPFLGIQKHGLEKGPNHPSNRR